MQMALALHEAMGAFSFYLSLCRCRGGVSDLSSTPRASHYSVDSVCVGECGVGYSSLYCLLSVEVSNCARMHVPSGGSRGGGGGGGGAQKTQNPPQLCMELLIAIADWLLHSFFLPNMLMHTNSTPPPPPSQKV